MSDPVAAILGYLRALVAIPTAYPPGDTTAMAAYLATTLAAMGYRTIRSVQPYICARVHAILVDGGRVTGGADPSSGGSVIAV